MQLTFPIKVQINALFKSFRNRRGFVRSLKPSQVLFVEPPTLFLEFSSGQVLEVGTGTVVEDVE